MNIIHVMCLPGNSSQIILLINRSYLISLSVVLRSEKIQSKRFSSVTVVVIFWRNSFPCILNMQLCQLLCIISKRFYFNIFHSTLSYVILYIFPSLPNSFHKLFTKSKLFRLNWAHKYYYIIFITVFWWCKISVYFNTKASVTITDVW